MDRFGNEVSCGGALWQPGGLSRAEFVSARWRSLPELPDRLAIFGGPEHEVRRCRGGVPPSARQLRGRCGAAR